MQILRSLAGPLHVLCTALGVIVLLTSTVVSLVIAGVAVAAHVGLDGGLEVDAEARG